MWSRGEAVGPGGEDRQGLNDVGRDGDEVAGTGEERSAGALRRAAWRSVSVGAVVLALAVGGAGLGLASYDSGAPGGVLPACGGSSPRLTVTGTGQATATPDLLTLVVEVDVTDPTAALAMAGDGSRTSAAVSALKRGGVAAKDIQTTGLSLQPQYSYPHGVPTLTGYQVTNTITARVHDLSSAGVVIDDVTSAAGNAIRIDSLAFSVVNTRSIEDQARADAVTKAVSHARAMAVAAGERLGPVCSLSDQTQTSPPIHENALAFGAAAAVRSPVPLQAGTERQSATVTLVYSLLAR